ncbi:DNA ligase D [Dokdonella ginsengisoli]|uniref:DNA ligase (ATP) n=1 Tax=Dokdonella ginsengisoli TaxID=363846 RepID=A0ABV9QW16_9GAMM
MSLREYVRKRRFDETPEPSGERGAKKGSPAPIFVVQLHHARARHYDFRLEVDGVLKSWAVPKGPSLRAGEKRLAVEVEDHPLSYATFEGDIPEGQYGAGHVDIFDHGRWSAHGEPLPALAKGRLDFTLHGQRLRGDWTLVRTRREGRQQQWLLFKRSDAQARDAESDDLLGKKPKPAASPAAPRTHAAKTPRARSADKATSKKWRAAALALPGARARPLAAGFAPQLCAQAQAPPAGGRWLHESKWDGYRLLADLDGGRVVLRSRNDLDWTGELPEIAAAIQALPVAGARLDGEMIAVDAGGRSDFSALQEARKSGDTAHLRYVLFDLPALEGVDLTQAPLLQRKQLLEKLLKTSRDPALGLSSHLVGNGAAVFQEARRHGLEGIVSKRVDAPYVQGRASTWIKIKHADTDEFAVVGYTAPNGSRTGFGSLLLARPEAGVLRYVGRVGSGFDDALLKTLAARMGELRRPSPTVALPSHVPFRSASVRWVEPRLVVEVEFRGWAKEGLLRQASFLRLRDDKSVEDLDMTKNAAKGRAARPAPRQSPVVAATPKKARTVGSVMVTHPERVVYPDAGITKQQVAEYYRAVAGRILPELIGRPLSILRCPDGTGATCFFQKHHADALGAQVRYVRLREKAGGSDRYLYIDDEAGLLELVQMNTIEFHPWGAYADAPDRPDRMIFDLDPAPDVAWPALIEAARDVRAKLREAGLESFVRLTGGKGVHVVAPIRRGPDWAEVKAFCEAFADAMVASSPLTYVATASKAKRRGRIFIDWLRNTRGATSVASWSLRARPGAPVAMPLRWEDLSSASSSSMYDLAAAQRRAARLRRDPWQGYDALDQRLPQVG